MFLSGSQYERINEGKRISTHHTQSGRSLDHRDLLTGRFLVLDR
jgi:hypothetical protein